MLRPRNKRANSPRFFAHFANAALASLLLTAFTASAQSFSTELSVRAAFLLNFSKFVVFPDRELPQRLCVIGDDPQLIAAIDEALRVTKNDSIIAKSAQLPADGCNVMYFAGDSASNHCRAAATLGERPVLTVAWAGGFAQCGGMIELTQIDNKFRFIINRRAAESHHLQMNSQLLSLATSVINP